MSKDDRITTRINKETKEDFQKLCKDNGTTPSNAISLYIHKALKTKKL